MIWVIGSKGMLGTELCDRLAIKGLEHFGTDRECNITDDTALHEAGMGKGIDWIINCAAYTAVDKAEDEEEVAHRINSQGAGNIARYARGIGARLIHISTDYVFSGSASEPYHEEDQPDPTTAYGRSKAAGELQVRTECSQHFILRTAWLYGKHGSNFVFTMLRLMRERPTIGVVIDQKGSPTWTLDLAKAIIRIIDTSPDFGTYHFTNEGEITWYDFAKEISRLGLAYALLDREIEIKPLRSEEYQTRARRPVYSVLSKRKAREKLGCMIPDWKSSLEMFIQELANLGVRERWTQANYRSR